MRNAQAAATEKAYVRLVFDDETEKYDATRNVELDSAEPLSAELQYLEKLCPVSFVIRGSDLRSYVKDFTPHKHYEFLAKSLRAENLTDLQSRIRSLQTSLRKAASDKKEFGQVDTDVKSLTKTDVKKWQADDVVAWVNAKLKIVGLNEAKSLAETDASLSSLAEKATNEVATIQRDPIEKAKKSMESLLPTGSLIPLHQPLDAIREARTKLTKLTTETAGAESKKVIDQAILLLSEHADLSTCPVCETPFVHSPYHTLKAVLERLKSLQQSLKDVEAASKVATLAETRLQVQFGEVNGVLSLATAALGVDGEPVAAHWKKAHSALLLDNDSELPGFTKALKALLENLNSRLASMEPGAPRIYTPLLETVKKLRALEKRHSDAESRRKLCEAMGEQVQIARGLIDKRVYEFFEDVVQAISQSTVWFYNKVKQGAQVTVSVKAELMDFENEDARGVEILTLFPNAPDEKPQAILSDSQIHTLALGMQIAIIRRFNKEVPFIVLDDVVTSYDADYRRQVATVLTEDFGEMQLLVLTHDDQFFQLVKSRLTDADSARWRSHRILKYAMKSGPTYSDARTPESEVDQYLVQGELAGNAIRQHVEDWLIQVSRGVGAAYPMRPVEKPYDYNHRELVEAVIEAAKPMGLEKAMETNSWLSHFVSELKAAVIENEGSHAHDNPYRKGSAGDDKSFWIDFKKFKGFFVCADTACGGKRFSFDPAKKKASCEKCGKHLVIKA